MNLCEANLGKLTEIGKFRDVVFGLQCAVERGAIGSVPNNSHLKLAGFLQCFLVADVAG